MVTTVMQYSNKRKFYRRPICQLLVSTLSVFFHISVSPFSKKLQIGVVSMEPGNVFELTNILLQNVFYIYIYIIMFIVKL